MAAQQIDVSFSEQFYNQSGSVDSRCNGILFVNVGTEPVTVLGYELLQGQSFAPTMNLGERDMTNYTVTFGTGAGTRLLLVIRKYYVA